MSNMNLDILKINNNYNIWGLTGTLLWSGVIAVSFIVIQIVTMIAYVGLNYPDVSPENVAGVMAQTQFNGLFLSFATLATFFGCNLIMLGIIKLKKGANTRHYLALNLVDYKTTRFWFLIIIGLFLVSEMITFLLGKPFVPDFVLTVYRSTNSIWLLWLAIVIAAPIFEELFFRGFVITGLSNTFIGPVGAIAVSSLAWAAIHLQYDLYLIFTIFIFGLVLGFVRLKTNSVLLTIGLHVFINAIAMIQASIIVN